MLVDQIFSGTSVELLGVTRMKHQRNFCDHGRVLYLDYGSSYMCKFVKIYWTLCLKWVHLFTYKLYHNKADSKKDLKNEVIAPQKL